MTHRKSQPARVRVLADVLDDDGMPEELVPWPGAEILQEIFCAMKAWAISSGGDLDTCEIERSPQDRVQTGVREAEWPRNDLRAALEVLRRTIADPALADCSAAALACKTVVVWAGSNDLPVTRFCYEALAGLNPPHEYWTLRTVGLMARDLARWTAARVWLEQAATIASSVGAWDEHILAVLGIGNVFYRQGLYKQARASFGRALSQARKYGLREREGRALHDLTVLAIEAFDMVAAERFARLALSAYGSGHDNIPALAHDLAFAWIRDGYPERALSVFQAVLPHVEAQPRDRLRVLANIAHAAAASGEKVIFRMACSEVQEGLSEPAAAAAVPSALLELANGAASLNLWDSVEEFAQAAMQVANERGEVDVIARADALLRSLPRWSTPVEAVAPRPQRGSATTCVALPGKASDALTEHLIRSIVVSDVLRVTEAADSGRPPTRHLPHEGVPLAPSPAAHGRHTVFHRCAWSGRVLEYATYTPTQACSGSESWEKDLHTEIRGSASFNRMTRRDLPPPHIHDPSVPGGVRAARPDEIPRGPW